MKTYDTVIWDLDGTLLNTLVDLKNAVNYSMQKLGYAERTLEEIRTFVGNGVKRLMELSLPGGRENPDYDLSYDYFNEFYVSHSLDNTCPYKGIPEVIAALKEAGVRQAIVSNKIDYAVKKLNEGFFGVDVSIGVTDYQMRKPAPDMVFAAMEKLGANPETTVYIGDSEVDLKTAENAGLDCISVLWGFRKKEEIAPFKPMCMVENPAEILKYVYVHEPTNLQCGQAVLAMITGLPVGQVTEELGNDRETTLKEMKEYLLVHGFQMAEERKEAKTISHLPSLCVLSLETPRCWHWSLLKNGQVCDPEHGLLKGFPESERKYYWEVRQG